MRFVRLFLALGAALLWAGCSGDDTAAPPVEEPTTFSGTLIRVDEDEPMAGLEVSLFHPEAKVVLARDVTDSAGRFAFVDLVAGPCIPVVHSTWYRPVFLPRTQWLIEDGDQIEVTLRMRRVTGILGDADLVLHGRVIDEETLEPIPNARVEMNFLGSLEVAEVNWSEYTGWANHLETTSDEDGRYVLGPVPIFQDILTERTNTPDHRVVAPGYRAKVMRRVYDPVGTDITLQAAKMVAGEDTGTVSGRVVDRFGEPVAGVAVSVEWRRVDNRLRALEPARLDFADRILLPGEDVFSDEEGNFQIQGLPDGYYVAIAGPYPDDGFVGISNSDVQVPGGAIELVAFPVIAPTAPPEGGILEDIPTRLEWEASGEATTWDLRLTRARDGARIFLSTSDPWLETSEAVDFFDGPDSYVWEVLARDATGEGISRTDRPVVFHVTDPD
jgi:protocatechuate 3,4-dioxygenase beta subunit